MVVGAAAAPWTVLRRRLRRPRAPGHRGRRWWAPGCQASHRSQCCALADGRPGCVGCRCSRSRELWWRQAKVVPAEHARKPATRSSTFTTRPPMPRTVLEWCNLHVTTRTFPTCSVCAYPLRARQHERRPHEPVYRVRHRPLAHGVGL